MNLILQIYGLAVIIIRTAAVTEVKTCVKTVSYTHLILDLEMPKDGVLTADFNGKKFEHTLGELLEGSRSHFMIVKLFQPI